MKYTVTVTNLTGKNYQSPLGTLKVGQIKTADVADGNVIDALQALEDAGKIALKVVESGDSYKAGGQHHQFGFIGVPANSATVGSIVASPQTLPKALAGTVVKVGVNPTAQAQFSVKVNGSAKGTITVATNGTVTLAAAAAVDLVAGDLLTIVGPADNDDTLANMFVMLATVPR